MQQLLQQLSPSSVVSQIGAPVYLLHDRFDGHVPFTESANFAAALTRLHHANNLVEFSIFQHTRVSGSLDVGSLLRDSPQLYGAIQSALLHSTRNEGPMLVLSLFWMLLGIVLGALVNGARWGLRVRGFGGWAATLGTLGIGAAG